MVVPAALADWVALTALGAWVETAVPADWVDPEAVARGAPPARFVRRAQISRCFVAGGGACKDNPDCGNAAYECEPSIGRCLRTDPGCDDSNDCVAGFACENDTCVDRRVPCETGSDCPHGFTCFFPTPDQRFCRRITRPCGTDLDCLVLGVPCACFVRQHTMQRRSGARV